MKNKIRTFLSNSYGFDQLSQHIYYLAIVLFVISLFTKITILKITSLVLMIYSLYRSLSNMRSQRLRELLAYRKAQRLIKIKTKIFFLNIKDRKNKYLVCDSCYKQLRVPRKKGKIEVTCSKCRHKFEVRT